MTWFNRMTEHWVVPQRLDLEQHVRRAGLQLVQTGTFGPQFYGLADDETVDRGWVGMPLIGIDANLDHLRALIPRLQEAGALVVGQMSMSWHYGDHETDKGLFGNWRQLWDQYLPGHMPCPSAEQAQQLADDGALRRWPIPGRPYYAYSGCMCNPHWLAMLAAMLEVAIELGVDGINVHHNFENFCSCDFCRAELSAWLTTAFEDKELAALYGTSNRQDLDPRHARQEAPGALRHRLAHEVQRAVHHRRKAAFDEVFIDKGRQLKPDLLLAQWYHKYDFSPGDERSLLPPELWACNEDYIWYSQGGNKGASDLKHGYIADMGLPARFVHAAGQGRPFVINKYDTKRLRLAIAEAAANHFAGPAFHWTQDADESFALEDYTAPVYRYQRFLADQANLIHPAEPWSQIGLVYPRRGELVADMSCTDSLRRLGRLLEDDHQFFDMLLDHQITERDLSGYRLLILPDVARLNDSEIACLLSFVGTGGRLLCSGTTGHLHVDGSKREAHGLPPATGVEWLDPVPTDLETFELKPDIDLPRVADLGDDPFGQQFLAHVSRLLDETGPQTDAPWWVRIRAWIPATGHSVVLHWVNYRQVEDAQIEVPLPTDALHIRCPLPLGSETSAAPVDRVEWLFPEGGDPVQLPHQITQDRAGSKAVDFTIPGLIVYGLAVIHLQQDGS
jgi:hypothetical protein